MTTSSLLSNAQKKLDASHRLIRKKRPYYQQFVEERRGRKKRGRLFGGGGVGFLKHQKRLLTASSSVMSFFLEDKNRGSEGFRRMKGMDGAAVVGEEEEDCKLSARGNDHKKNPNSTKKNEFPQYTPLNDDDDDDDNNTPKKRNEFALNPPPTDIKRQTKKVSLDLITTECIKLEAEALPLPCCVYTLASALHDNDNVFFQHVHQSSYEGEEEEDCSEVDSEYSGSSSRRLSFQFQNRLSITEESEVTREVSLKQRREMKLKKAFKELESSVGSLERVVRNWREARCVLEEVLIMPFLDCDVDVDVDDGTKEESKKGWDLRHVEDKESTGNDDGVFAVANSSAASASSSVWSTTISGSRRGGSSNHHHHGSSRKHSSSSSNKISPKKKKRSSKRKGKQVNDAVKRYCAMVTKEAIKRHLLPVNHKWNQIESIKLPARLKPPQEEEENEERKRKAKKEQQQQQQQEEISVTTSTDDLLDQRLNERIAKIEQIARSKSKKQYAHIDSLILQREEKEEELKKEQERIKKQEEEEAKAIASSLLRPFEDNEKYIIRNAVFGQGPGSEVLARCDADTVLRDSMRTLRPGQWLNDEVIHYFLLMLSKRDEQMCAADPSKKRCHFFKSFFITKLFDEGNVTNQGAEGRYNYSNVKRWSKRVPGKDIFKLDKIFFPINAGGVHWCCAVVYMTKKKIQFYDSLGGEGMFYLRGLMRYLKDEHQAKKGCPLPEEEKWELVTCTRDTPFQENGFDCGVFTCMYADFLSKDCLLKFSQHHVTECRDRIALSIMNGSAIH